MCCRLMVTFFELPVSNFELIFNQWAFCSRRPKITHKVLISYIIIPKPKHLSVLFLIVCEVFELLHFVRKDGQDEQTDGRCWVASSFRFVPLSRKDESWIDFVVSLCFTSSQKSERQFTSF